MEYDTIFAAARRAGNELTLVDAGRLSRTVVKAAALLRENAGKVLAANALDLEAMDADSPMRDRLRLTAERIASIAADMESVAGLPSPQGETIAEWTRPNGMTLRKVRVPFGVVGMICEARPNVTADIFSLSMKTGNACVLKGGSDARRSNEAIAALLREALRSEGIDPAAFTLLPSDHEAVAALLGAVGKYAWGWVCDRTTPLFATKLLFLCNALSLACIFLPHTLFNVILFVVGYGVCMGGIWTVFPSVVAYLYGKKQFPHVYKYISLFVAVKSLGYAAVGLSHSLTGNYNMAYMGMVILLLAAFAATSTIREHEAAEGNVFSTCN